MTSPTIRFEPIATQIARQVSAAALFPDGVLEAVRPESDPNDLPLPPDVETFHLHYFAVVRAAVALLDAPAFERLARLSEAIEEEYMPGGPPMSPVYDSFSVQHVLAEVPVGPADETPHSVVAKLTSGSPARSRFHALARALADACFDLYRVVSVSGLEAELSPVRGGDSLSVKTTGPFFRRDDVALVRVLPFEGNHFVADSPYLLKAPVQDWLDYFERVAASLRPRAATANDRPKGKMSPKQEAKWRQRQRSSAQNWDPEAAIRLHLKRGRSERYWLDYVLDAYAGERNGIVYLAGVPDRPETLPHSSANVPAPRSLTPMARLHERLQEVAARDGMLAQAAGELDRAFKELGVEKEPLDPNDLQLFIAYSTLEARSKEGSTALDRVEPEWASEPEMREAGETVRRGGFGVLRVDRIHLDEGLDVFEARSGKKLFVSERSGTRQLAQGDLLLGWLCAEPEGNLILEGHVTRVPALFADPVIEFVRSAQARRRKIDFRESPGTLPIRLLVALRKLRETFVPELVNTSGDRLQLATGRFLITDRARALAGLAKAFTKVDDGTYAWLDETETVLARIEVVGDKLMLRVNSLERLQAAKARVQASLGDAVKPSLDDLEPDLAETIRTRRSGGEARALQLPPEAAAQIRAVVVEKIRDTLDSPIPQFRGKTLRQVARAKNSRPDAVSWLREQERLLKSNPQLADIDLRPIWRELNLEYQGLETDPSI